jgi:hypothetical protein
MALVAGFASCSPQEVDPNTALTPDQHTVNFPINIDGGVHTLDCNVCHGDFDSFSDFTCTSGCHSHDQQPMDSAHVQIVPAYAWSSTSCYECHPAGVVPAGIGCVDGGLPDGGWQLNGCFSHEPYYPIRPGETHDGCSQDAVIAALAAKGRDLNADDNGLTPWLFDAGFSGVTCPPFPGEGGIACLDCHPNPLDHTTPYVFGTFDGGVQACLNCHPNDAMAAVHDAGLGVGAWIADTTTCLSSACHKQGALGPP